jgi:hypothetical protein
VEDWFLTEIRELEYYFNSMLLEEEVFEEDLPF